MAPLMRAWLLVLSIATSTPASAAAEDWRSVLNRDGVQVFARSVPGSPVWELRAAATFAVPAEQLLALLVDTPAYPKNMPPTEAVRLLRRDGGVSFVHMVINPPFISRRDSCIRTWTTRLPSGQLLSQWRPAPELCPPPRSGVVRMPENSGRWLLTPLPGGRGTQVEYEIHSDPGGKVPAWMVNRGTARSLPELFRTIQKGVTEPRYARATLAPSARAEGEPSLPSP